METVYYVLLVLAIVGICVLGVYLKKKFNISKDDTDFAKVVLEVIDYINSKYNKNYSQDKVKIIIKYCFMALDIVEKYEVAISFDEKRELVISEAKTILKDNNIIVDEEIIKLINTIVDYILMNFDLPIEKI